MRKKEPKDFEIIHNHVGAGERTACLGDPACGVIIDALHRIPM